jgi:uncharacterized protein DUF4153
MLKQNKLIVNSLLIGVLYTVLFYNKSIGISYPIFIMLITLLLAYTLKQTSQLKKDLNWYFLIPIGLLSMRYFVSSNSFFHFFNHIGIIILFLGMTLLLIGKEPYKFESFSFLLKIVKAIFCPFSYFLKPYSYLYRKLVLEKKKKHNTQLKKVFIGILISTPILIIIISLLSSADIVFSEMISFLPTKFSYFLSNTNFINTVAQLLLIVFVATYSYSCIYYLFTPNEILKKEKDEEKKVVNNQLPTAEQNKVNGANVVPSKEKIFFDTTILTTVLVMINIVYLVFCFIQFTYLFSNGSTNLPGGFTYAEYARQGFFQLLLVTMLNFIIIILSFKYTDFKDVKIIRRIHGLLLLMGIFTYIMIYSSFYRMGLYSQNYGYTYLRVFVYFFLSIETILLGATLVYIIKPKFNLAKFYVLTFLIFYIGLNYLNIDSMIAKNNIDRYFETGKIDFYYLTTLSYDAVPQISRLLETENPIIRREVEKYFKSLKEEFNQKTSWQEFNHSNNKAKVLISTLI